MRDIEIKLKIKERMEKIQTDMETGYHLEDPEVVSANIMQVSKFWSILSEEDKDYIQAAKIAIRDKLEWK